MCSDCLRDVPALAGRRIKKQAIRIVAICPLLCCIDQATLCLGSHGQYGAAVTLEIWFDSQGTQHCLPQGIAFCLNLLLTPSLRREIKLILHQGLVVICRSLSMPRANIIRFSHQSAIRSVMSACNLNLQLSKIPLPTNYVLSLLYPTAYCSFLCLLCCINILACSSPSYSFSSQVSLCQLLATSWE